MKDALRERGLALENEFFDKQNRHLLEELRNAHEHEAERQALAKACGVRDVKLLDRLLANHVRAENIAALSMVPLILVAWADREIAWNEKQVILRAAADHGIEEGSAPYALLDHWLGERPKHTLAEAWTDYVKKISSVLDPQQRAEFAESTLRHAREVSHAAGGLLRGGMSTTREQRVVLERLAETFEVD